MSKVVNAIMAKKGDRARPKQTKLFRDVFTVREDIQTVAAGIEVQYRIGVTLGAECWVDEISIISEPDALEMAIDRSKRQVIEAIFGEFRADFRNIERALYDRNIEEARVMLHDLEKKMFEVTIDE